MSDAPSVGQQVSWRYGKGFARGEIVTVGIRSKGRPMARMKWTSTNGHTRTVARFVDELLWPGKPYDVHGDRGYTPGRRWSR